MSGVELPTAIDVSSGVGLVAVGIFTAQILLGLLLSVGYNPLRRFPPRRIKLFTFHHWLGLFVLATTLTPPLILLFSREAVIRLLGVFVPLSLPTQPFGTPRGPVF